MIKRRIWIPLLATVTFLVIVTSQFPKLYIATGYGAKCMASGVFVAGRDPELVKANDLDYSIVKYTTNRIDYMEKSVTTTFFGFARQKALFRDGFGCFLVDEPYSANSFPLKTAPVSNILGQPWKRMWPDGDLLCDSLFPEINGKQLNMAVSQAFDLPGSDKLKRTAAVVVSYKGKLVLEKYWSEQSITPDTRLPGWSMAKSIQNALTGILVRQNRLSVLASAPVEEWLNDRRREITLNDLLHMSSGLKWEEEYGDVSDATNMLYRERDCYHSGIVAPFDEVADNVWKYSSGTANIISGIIRKTISNDDKYAAFPYNELFGRIGMTSMVLEADAAGYFVGSSYAFATARDWARFGQLYLQNGVWKGDTILPKDWVAYSATSAKAAKGQYGALFWLNRSGELPDIPQDMFYCRGHRGQRIFIIPSRQLVVVRLGFAEDEFDFNQFLGDILSAFSR